MKYLDYVYVRQLHVLVNSRKSTFPINADFFSPKRFKGYSQFRSCITN